MNCRISLAAMVGALAIAGAACSSNNAPNKGANGSGSSSSGAAGASSSSGSTGSGSGTSGSGGGGSSSSSSGSTNPPGGSSSSSGGSSLPGGSGSSSGGTSSGSGSGSVDGGMPVVMPVTCTGPMSGTAKNTLAVDVSSAQTVVNPGIFGLLMERIGRDITGGLYVGTNSSIPNTSGMRNDIIQGFKDAGVGMIEWPGGCAANSYNWNPPNPANDVGTDRYMQLTSMLGIPPYLAGPGTAAGANSNLQWVTYVNNNTAHPDWQLSYFKVGNEVWGCGGNQTEATYETNYLANFNALSAPINGKKLSLVASTGLIGNFTWLNTELANLASKIDGIEIHDYLYHPNDIPCVGFTDNQYYNIVNAANKGQIGPRLDTIVASLNMYDPTKHIQIWEDEWGDWLEPLNATQDTWLQQITVMDAISTAEQLHLFMQHADRVTMAGMAQAINVIHSLFLTRSSDAALVKTPAYYVFQMFIPHHSSGAKWAPNTLVSENVTGNGATFPVLSAGTTVDNQGHVNVSLANVDLVNTRTIQITLTSSNPSYVVSSAQVITGPAKDSFNDFAQPESVNIQPLAGSNCAISGKSLTVTLPAKSVVMIVLASQ